MWNASDEALVAGLGAGDTDAALVLVRRFQSRVYGLALSIVRDRHTAEEVAQDTFVRAWRYSASFDPRRGSVVTWLLAIARNVALDHVRANGRRRDQPTAEPVELFVDVMAAADEPTSPHDELAVVAGALRSLPQEQRDVVMAAAYYGLTAREISEARHLPLGTVKTRLRLAVHKLRNELTGVPR